MEEPARSGAASYWRPIWEGARREFRRNNPGSLRGWPGTFLRPALLFATLYALFEKWMGKLVAGYAAYLLIGVVLWDFFQSATSAALGSLRRDDGPAPREIAVFSVVAAAFWPWLLECAALLTAVRFLGAAWGWTWLFVPALLLLELLLVAGLSLFLAQGALKHPGLGRSWATASWVLFFLTPIFYPLDMLNPRYQALLRLNPLLQILQAFRGCVLSRQAPSGWLLLTLLGVGALLLAAGRALPRGGSGAARPEVPDGDRRGLKAAALLAGLLLAAALLAGGEAFLGGTGAAQCSSEWLLEPMLLTPPPIFVPAAGSGPDGRADLLTTDPRLVKLDNPPQTFSSARPPGTLRVFCLGGSTTVGWPFHPRGSYPAWLRLMLRDALPGRPSEVIIAALHGSDSFRDLAAWREVSRYGPDIVLVYSGLNEGLDYHSRHIRGLAAWCLRRHYWLVLHSQLYGAWLDHLHKPALTARLRSGDPMTTEHVARMLAEFEAHLRGLVREIRAAGARPALLTLAYNERGARVDAAWPRENLIIRRVAAQEGALLVDLERLAAGVEFVDSNHPTPEGYRRYARIALEALCRDPGSLAGACRLERLSAPARMRQELGLDDPQFQAAVRALERNSRLE